MAVGDGSAWDETTPVDATLVSQIDDYTRDLRIGVRSRMTFEHEWPSSQAATAEGGKHKFVTLQNQAAKPTLSGTQVGAIYQKTSALFYEDSGGVEILITSGTGLNIPAVATTGIAKAWLFFNPATATGSFMPIESYNILGMSKVATGNWLVTFSSTFSSTTYVVVGGAGLATTAAGVMAVHVMTKTKSGCTFGVSNSVDTPTDNAANCDMIFMGLQP